MAQLKKITKARTPRELERLVADDTERGWNVVSRMKYISQDPRPYQMLLIFNTENDQMSL
ncbi:hypothetical protein ACZ11_07475 [Lysinibacillus xylanilyticus]|uniref:Uncharacterized protein n=1 Tax=Lysinibacillus xylanilyticus TaxID=582475 RepID=A0A0K9FCS4_9BACI|nr:hypothetical protein [Lysinibacillus xylanilyticus]KMY32007.1 hypothetical protein ACZ11_07475 [Lysinibacillus xylanilyticus]